jgi:hypothetical protein
VEPAPHTKTTTVPESLVIIVIGSIATVFIVIRLISIPEAFVPNDGRSVGIRDRGDRRDRGRPAADESQH